MDKEGGGERNALIYDMRVDTFAKILVIIKHGISEMKETAGDPQSCPKNFDSETGTTRPYAILQRTDLLMRRRRARSILFAAEGRVRGIEQCGRCRNSYRLQSPHEEVCCVFGGCTHMFQHPGLPRNEQQFLTAAQKLNSCHLRLVCEWKVCLSQLHRPDGNTKTQP